MSGINFEVSENTKVKSIDACFCEGFKNLERKGYRLPSLKENAFLRMKRGYSSDITKYGNWTCEAGVYDLDKGVFLTPNSPILSQPEVAAKINSCGQQYLLTKKQIQEASIGAIPFSGVHLGTTQVYTKKFGDSPLMNSLFQEYAGPYGMFLKRSGIEAVPVWFFDEEYMNMVGKTFAVQIFFCGLDQDSRIYGRLNELHTKRNVVGIK